MRRSICITVCVLALLALGAAAQAYHVAYDFDTPWTGDYAPGWENTEYRYGPAPEGKMMEYIMGGMHDSGALRLIAATTPADWYWWADVSIKDSEVNAEAMAKQYDPWVSVWYYDRGWETGSLHQAGQLCAIPSWVNMYVDDNGDGTGDSDWTDIQYGARMNQAPTNDKYYYVACGEDDPGWQNTGVARVDDNWVQLKMQLSSADGKVHFYLRTDEANPFTEVGQSWRNDYVDLLSPTLSTVFTNPLSGWTNNKPSTIWDDFEFGSTYVPEPSSVAVLLTALVGAAGMLRRRK